MIYALMAVLVAVILLIVFGAPHLERALLYHPSGGRVTPQAAGLENVDEVKIPTPDGETLIAWYAPAAIGKQTLLYFHGNGASLKARSERIRKTTGRGFGVFMMSYRGYSGSTGTPSEHDNVTDALLAFDLLVKKGIPPEQIVLYGESLGTGVAVQVAAQKPVGAIILDAPYTSIIDVAELCYPMLPARLFMRDRYETMRHLKSVTVPLLVIHGEADRVIPVEMGRTVAAAAPGPTTIKTFPNAGHTDHADYGSTDAVTSWLDGLN